VVAGAEEFVPGAEGDLERPDLFGQVLRPLQRFVQAGVDLVVLY